MVCIIVSPFKSKLKKAPLKPTKIMMMKSEKAVKPKQPEIVPNVR